MEDIFERTRAFAMDELHYDTMAASYLDFNAKMITTAPEAAGWESQLKKLHEVVADSRKMKRMLAKLRGQGSQL